MNDLPELSGPLGSRLRQAREAQGLALQYVSERLKFSVRQLEALEAGQFGQFSNRAQVRGFVRAYARLLQLPEAELLVMVDQEVPPDAPVPERPQLKGAVLQSPRRVGLPLLLTVIVALMLFSAGAGWFFYGWLQRTQLTQPPEPENQLLMEADVALEPTLEASAAAASLPQASAAPAPVRSTAPAATTTASAIPALPVAGSKGLLIQASGASWLEVSDGRGKSLYRALTRPGQQIQLAGPEPLRITAGKADAVRMYYAGKPVDLAPHTRGEVARLQLP